MLTKHSNRIPWLEFPEKGAEWTAEAARVAASDMNTACSEFGYFFLANHGIAADALAAVVEETREFYARPMSEKAIYRSSAQSQFLGYRCLGAERSLSHSGAEACEQYRIGNVHSGGPNPHAVDCDLFHRPFRKSMALFADLAAIGHRLMAVGATGLGQEPSYFNRFFDAPMHRLGLNLYEAGASARIGNSVSYAMSPHVDHAVFTVVAQDEPGLEVLVPGGEWLNVPVVPDALFVFAGDYFQRWTNGRFRATQHRVGQIRTDRISIQYKHKPSNAIVVEPLAPFVSSGRPARYEAFNTGHQYENLLATLLAERQAG